ncbi:MAG: GNAT family N-acetyltransferase [Chloroflexi bacterium]|nr:GNAT family N-acetyltransferase [Chloroflexota bacterium]
MRPEWCYLAVQADVPVARFAFWTLPKVGTPLSIVLLDVAPDGVDRAAVAQAVLARAIADALATNTSELGHVIDEPSQTPQWQTEPEERAAWLESAGFRVVRATSRWSFDGPPPPVTSDRLRFSTFEEVGEGVFLDVLERVSVATLDARVRADRDRLGPAGEARETLADLRSMEWQPAWWELAFDSDGALVGLVMPTRAPSMTTIGYVGVVPEQRGRGYVDDLLARGTATLRRAVPNLQIRADTDVANVPMAAAFARAGYQEFASRREFEYPVEQGSGWIGASSP